MTRESFLILLGVLVALSPFLGLPLTWLAVLLPLLGLITLGIGYTLRARLPRREPDSAALR